MWCGTSCIIKTQLRPCPHQANNERLTGCFQFATLYILNSVHTARSVRSLRQFFCRLIQRAAATQRNGKQTPNSTLNQRPIRPAGRAAQMSADSQPLNVHLMGTRPNSLELVYFIEKCKAWTLLRNYRPQKLVQYNVSTFTESLRYRLYYYRV